MQSENRFRFHNREHGDVATSLLRERIGESGMSMKWVSAARRAMLASICTSAFAVSGQALAQDVPSNVGDAIAGLEFAGPALDVCAAE